MQKIFKTQYEKLLLKYINANEYINTKTKFDINFLDLKNINLFYKKYVPKDLLLIKKFPEADLKNIIKHECNVDKIKPNTNEYKQIITSTKNFRKYANINEKSVCSRCTKKSTCKFFEFVPNEIDLKVNMLDLQTILHGYYLNSLNLSDDTKSNPYDSNNSENQKIFFSENLTQNNNSKNNNSIKLSSINLNKKNEKNSNYFSDNQNKNQKDFTFNNYYFIDSENQSIIDRIPANSWKSSSILTQLIKDTLEDLINDNGIVYKTMINSYIENKNKENISSLIKDNKIKELNKRDEIKNDPIVGLIEKLETCNNRREKKRLLAEFNKTVGFGWGEYRKFPKFNEFDGESYKDDIKPDSNNDNRDIRQKDKIVQQISYENKVKNSNNNNTTVLSDNKIKKIFFDSKKINLIGNKFTQTINVKNQKIKALENQKKLSLLLNQESSDRTYVKIPGADYNKAVLYIGEKEGKLDEFNNVIDARKNELSVDLKNYVYNKKGKLDKKLEEVKKITLLQLEKLESAKMLENDKIQNKNVLLPFESKFEKNHTLLEENKSLYIPCNFSDQPSSKIEYENNNLVEYNENKINTNSVNFRKLNLKNDDSNIALFKQENQVIKDNIKINQEKAKVQKILDNKHIYQSMNYYKNSDLEHLAYERDPDVMNALKFKKSIKKDKYFYDVSENNKNKNNPYNNK